MGTQVAGAYRRIISRLLYQRSLISVAERHFWLLEDRHLVRTSLAMFMCSLAVKRLRTVDQDLECTLASGQGQAADLTICRACSCSNLTGLRYRSAEWSRLLL